MTALSAARLTTRLGDSAIPDLLKVPMKASVKGYQGGIAVLSGGYAAPATAALGLRAIGRFEKTYDNSAGSNGAITAEIRTGAFKFGNSASGDAIAAADVGKIAYLVDDQTVAKTDNNGARSPAGVIVQVETDGIYVLMGLFGGEASPGYEEAGEVRSVLSFNLNLADIASGAVLSFIPGFAGRIIKTQFTVTKAATTGSKAATLTPRIATVAVTGGVLALTSANMTPAGAVVQGTAVTAANTFISTDTIDIQASAVTAFVEGAGTLLITLG